jgi:DNA repair exonuclease SbcCD ATPase subunit
VNVKRVRIKNVLGIEAVDLRPGAVTLVSGANGTGKTSVIDAVRWVFDGGHDPGILHLSAESGSVKITLDNGVEIEKKVTATRSSYVVEDSSGNRVEKPATFVKALVDGEMVDPTRFLSLDEKEQIATLVRAFLPNFDVDKDLSPALSPVVGEEDLAAAAKAFRTDPKAETALDRLEAARQCLYDRRRDAGRDAKQAEITATGYDERIGKLAPPEGSEELDVDAVIAESERIAAALQAVETERIRSESAAVASARNAAAQRLSRVHSTTLEDLARIAESIEELRRQIEKLTNERTLIETAVKNTEAAEAQKLEAEIAAIRASARAEAAKSVSALEKERAALEAKKARAEEVSRNQTLIKELARLRDETTANGEKLRERHEELETGIETIDRLKNKILSQMDLGALDIRGGQLFVDDVPFSHVEESRRTLIAVEIAKKTAGDLGFLFMDRGEVLDDERFRILRDSIRGTRFQLLIARVVSGKPLAVRDVTNEDSIESL